MRVKELIADKAFQDGRGVTMDAIAKQTGIHRMTLWRMVNIHGYTTRSDFLDKLCVFFGCRLDQPAELVPDTLVNRVESDPDKTD